MLHAPPLPGDRPIPFLPFKYGWSLDFDSRRWINKEKRLYVSSLDVARLGVDKYPWALIDENGPGRDADLQAGVRYVAPRPLEIELSPEVERQMAAVFPAQFNGDSILSDRLAKVQKR